MSGKDVKDRAVGAIMGAFIGDALALGPHWYYNLDDLRRDYGDWITGYTDPKPGRYHADLRAGQQSQAGFILELTLASLVERGEYDVEDFCQRMDHELFPLLDGTPCARPVATRMFDGTAVTTHFDLDYAGGHWHVFGFSPIPVGTQFNVLVDPSQVAACSDVIFADGFGD